MPNIDNLIGHNCFPAIRIQTAPKVTIRDYHNRFLWVLPSPTCSPTNSVKALNGNAQTYSTDEINQVDSTALYRQICSILDDEKDGVTTTTTTTTTSV